MKPAAITTYRDWAADTAARARALHTKADAATDWTERDRMRRAAYALDDDARFFAQQAARQEA